MADSFDKPLEPGGPALDPLGDEVEVEIVPDDPAEEEEERGDDIKTPGFDDNLAEHIDDEELDEIASELMDLYTRDKASRSEWERTYIRGLDLLGLKIEDRTTPWPGACGVFHPILAEAAVRFQAQSIMEIWPASGPVKTEIIGNASDELEARARRVEQDMNWFCTEKMPEYRDETERMLFALPLAGSAFRKICYDPTLKRPVATFVPAEDAVVNYGATSLHSRLTHIMRMPIGEVRKLQEAGFYRKVELEEPSPDYDEVDQAKDEITGQQAAMDDDDRLVLLEMTLEYDLKDIDDSNGKGLPYVITIDQQTQQILSIYRNWDEEDKSKAAQSYFAHHKYLPSMGFYGYGLIHLIGGIAKASTSALRQLVDAGSLANLPAGLKTRGLRIKGDDSPIMPGEWRDCDVPGGAIRDNIFPMPYKEPSAVLYQLLGNLVDEGRRMASIADLQVGDMNQQSPVGTTLALLERAMKVMSAVQARLHASMEVEFKMLAKVIIDHMPSRYEYPVEPPESNRDSDYGDRIDIVPVSDPNASTMSQRVVQYQALLQLAASKPDIYNMPELHRQVAEVLGIKDIDKIIPNTEDLKPTDPVSENMAILTGRPVKAFLFQDHEAHIKVHLAAAQDPLIMQLVGQSPNAPAIQQAAAAHLQEHIAFAYRNRIEKQLGTNLPNPEVPLPPEVEYQLSSILADAAQKLLQSDAAQAQQQQAQQAAQDPLIQIQQRDQQLKEQKAGHDAQISQAELALKAKAQEDKTAIERERIASEERIAGAKLGSQAAQSQLDADAQADQMQRQQQSAAAQAAQQQQQQAQQSQQQQQQAQMQAQQQAAQAQAERQHGAEQAHQQRLQDSFHKGAELGHAAMKAHHDAAIAQQQQQQQQDHEAALAKSTRDAAAQDSGGSE